MISESKRLSRKWNIIWEKAKFYILFKVFTSFFFLFFFAVDDCVLANTWHPKIKLAI